MNDSNYEDEFVIREKITTPDNEFNIAEVRQKYFTLKFTLDDLQWMDGIYLQQILLMQCMIKQPNVLQTTTF